jgi:hypothetical protein
MLFSSQRTSRQPTRAVLESLVLIDSCPAVFWQEAKSAHSPHYVSDERRGQKAAGREDMDKTFENCSRWKNPRHYEVLECI